MIELLKRAFDAARLAKELEAAEERIKNLEFTLRNRSSGPMFMEVAKTFDVSHIHDRVIERVIKDMSVFVEPEMLHFMKAAGRNMQRTNLNRMDVQVAYDNAALIYEFEFISPKMGTRIQSVT